MCIIENGERSHKHLIVEEHYGLRNKRFVPDNKDNFMFGDSDVLSLEDCVALLRYEIEQSEYLVGHSFSNDASMLSSIGISTEGIKRLDTANIANVSIESHKSTIGLKDVLKHYNIDYTHLHNAGNDSAYTMQALVHMVN